MKHRLNYSENPQTCPQHASASLLGPNLPPPSNAVSPGLPLRLNMLAGVRDTAMEPGHVAAALNNLLTGKPELGLTGPDTASSVGLERSGLRILAYSRYQKRHNQTFHTI